MAHHSFLRQLGLFTVPDFLTPAECAQWRELAAASGGVEARVYRDGAGHLDEEQRKTLSITVKHPLQLETERRIEALRGDIERRFGVELNELDKVSCLVYRPGDFFRIHADVTQRVNPRGKFANILRRCVTIIVFLNDPGDVAAPYQGGDLRLYGLMQTPGGANFGFPADAERGLLLAFRATTPHEVSPVTQGIRYTLVTWFLARQSEDLAMITTTSKPKRRESIESQPLPDGSGLLFDPDSATAYPITESALRIWQLCDGEHEVESILDDLEAHYDVDRPTLEQDSFKLLDDLAQKGLLEPPPPPQ